MARSRHPHPASPVTVDEGTKEIRVKAHGHSWIALLRDGVEFIREQTREATAAFVVRAGEYEIRTDGEIDEVDTASSDVPDASPPTPQDAVFLQLSADAADRHAVDGVGEVPADGVSFCTITVDKMDADHKPLRRRADVDEIFLRATGGTLMDEAGHTRARSVRLRAGRGRFRLVADTAPKVVTVSAFAASSAARAQLQIEFI